MPSIKLSWLFAIAVVLVTLAGVAAYPFARLELALALLVYAGLGIWRPYWMLFCVPVWLALVNLAPWSGSLYLEDYDLLLGTTLAVFLLRGLYGMRIQLMPLQWLAIGLLTLALLIAFVRGFFPFPAWDVLETSSLYSRWSALRLSKSLWWALLLLPALSAALHAYGDKARNSLIWGLALAGAVVGLAAMWERHVFSALATGSRYEILGSLLDFTTPYRITGLFSEMHTGGEAIDGFMALVWPFGLLAVATARTRARMAVAAVALLCALYAVVTTFSRVSYLALAAGLLTGGLLLLLTKGLPKTPGGSSIQGVLPALLIPLALSYVHTRGGVVSLAAVLAAWGGSLVLGYFATGRKRLLGVGVALLLCVGATYGMARGMVTSKWVENTPAFAWQLASGLALVATATGFWTGAKLAPAVRPRTIAILLLMLVGGSAVVAPALLGSRMEVRFSTNQLDAGTRSGHWQHALDVMQSDWPTRLFGMGVGRFPEEYLYVFSRAHGNFGFKHDGDHIHLILGGGEDLTFGQRLGLPAWDRYTLKLNARTNDPLVNLRIRVCRRHILVPYDWNPQCVGTNQQLKNTGGVSQSFVWTFDIGALGDGVAFGRQPLLLELKNEQYRGDPKIPGTLVEIDTVSVTDARGVELLSNGNFAHGLERWFPYYDFEHLPWHIKNLWVNLYFDQGWVGVAGFIAFLLTGISVAIRLALKNDMLGVAVASAIASYMTVGVAGGLVDVPRVILVFYVLLIATLLINNLRADSAQHPDASKSKHTSRARHNHDKHSSSRVASGAAAENT
jgi:hypothetical protein